MQMAALGLWLSACSLYPPLHESLGGVQDEDSGADMDGDDAGNNESDEEYIDGDSEWDAGMDGDHGSGEVADGDDLSEWDAGGCDGGDLQIDTTGGDLLWAVRVDGSAPNDWGSDISILDDGSCLVNGHFFGTATFGQGEANETVLSSAWAGDGFIARYNPDGTLAWAKQVYGPGVDSCVASSALPDGSVYMTGHVDENTTFGPGEPPII